MILISYLWCSFGCNFAETRVFFSDLEILRCIFQLCQGSFFQLQHLATFESDLLHSASQPYHTPYIIPIHIYQLTMSNHVSYSVLLSLALRALIFCLITGVVTHQSKEIHRRLFLICSISDQYRTPIFSGWVFLWKNLKLSPATHAELFRGSAPFELVGSCRPCRSWSSLLSSQPSWQLPMGWSERLEPWSSTWTFHGSNEADTLVGMFFLFQKKMLEFFEADKRYLFLVTLMFSKYVFLLKHVKSAKVAHWDGRTETAQSRCSQKKSRCGKFMGKSHRLFWICESSLELPKPVWRPNSTWVSIAILQRFFQCKHHVIQVNCFFVFFVAHYVLQHVYIYNYIYINIYLSI